MSGMKRSSGGWSERFPGGSSTGRIITTAGTTTSGWRAGPTFGTACCRCSRACCPPTSTSTASTGSAGCGTHTRHVLLGEASTQRAWLRVFHRKVSRGTSLLRSRLPVAGRHDAGRHRLEDAIEVAHRGELDHDLPLALAELDLDPGLEGVREPVRYLL